MKSIIIAHGDKLGHEVIMDEVEKADIIICADGGAEYAYKNNIIPHYLIGDFDSIDGEIFDFYSHKGVNIIKFPVEKDYTDTEICINKAIELGCSEIGIVSGIGSRIDHSLGNIGLLHICSKRGANGYIISPNAVIYHCMDEIEIEGETGETVSIIPFNGDVNGITTEGLAYGLKEAVIKFGSPIGISNLMTDRKCKIKIKSGEILVIKQIID